MPRFIKGMTLCESFFSEIARPVLEKRFPGLLYSAGLLGSGSDVLGYDDPVSTDHMWGPQFALFLRDGDMRMKDDIQSAFSEAFPYTFRGYSVHFSAPDPNDGGVRVPESTRAGRVSSLVSVNTVDAYLDDMLGTHDLTRLTGADWLAFSETKLLALTAGRLFADGLDMSARLAPLAFYPDAVRRYLIASNWSLAAEEQAFAGRCAMVGDDMGASLVCARVAERLMRLCFLYCGRYAPYGKWFGTAFRNLPVPDALKEAIKSALTGADTASRIDGLVLAQKLTADIHNASGVTPPLEARVQSYFSRDIRVIWADRFAAAVAETLRGTEMEGLPLIGTMSEVANFTALYDHVSWRENIKALYAPRGAKRRARAAAEQ